MISVLISSYGGWEWNTLALERAYPSAQRENPAQIICEYQASGTIATSRNAAAEQANQDWLLFLDADDELAPGYIPAMTAAVNAHPDPWTLFTPQVSYVVNRKPRRAKFWPEMPLRQANWLVIGTLVSKELFDDVGGFREFPHGLEDWNLWARCVRAGASILRVPDAIYVAHWNRNSKHHELSRDRDNHMYWYRKAGEDAWPDWEMPVMPEPRRRVRR